MRQGTERKGEYLEFLDSSFNGCRCLLARHSDDGTYGGVSRIYSNRTGVSRLATAFKTDRAFLKPGRCKPEKSLPLMSL